MFFQIKMAIIAVIILSGIGGIWYIKYLQDEARINAENAAKLMVAVAQQQEVLTAMKQDQQKIVAINADVKNKISQQTAEVTSLRTRFEENAAGDKRDLGNLAVKKPGLIEIAVNKGSDNALRCMEIVSGSPLTQQELAATLPTEINRECPSIANPKYKKDAK